MISNRFHETAKSLSVICALSLLVGCAREESEVCVNEAPGFLITNVMLIDGSGSPAIAADVRVSDGLIAETGQLSACQGEMVVAGGGQVLAPGFIDTHSHADGSIFDRPDALPVVSQGITTIVVGQDGGSWYPLVDFYTRFEASPATVNIASYVGHNTLRMEVMGEDGFMDNVNRVSGWLRTSSRRTPSENRAIPSTRCGRRWRALTATWRSALNEPTRRVR